MAEQERNPIVQATSHNPLPNPIIIQQDTSGFPVSIILNETNYMLWSQLMEMRIGARNKVGYLTGAVAKPAPNDPNYATWITENHKVKSWIIESMSPHLMQRFIRLITAREIWEAVSKTFYDGSDETRLFELNQQSFSTTQNGRPLSTYYNELVAIFQEIDHRSTSHEESVEGIVQLHAAMMRLRVHIFLSGLDSEFDQIRGEILRKEPKMDLEAAYACVRRESQQRQIMGVPRLISENTVMIANRNQRGTGYNSSKGKNSQGSGKQNNYVCTHCGESGHSKLRCYELIGYPEWWDFSKKPRKNITGKAALAISGESLPVQEETLMPTANVTQPGSIGYSDAEDSWLWC